MKLSVREIVERLGLHPHPEGGYYREVYRSHESIAWGGLPARFKGDRPFGTSIYFLLTGETFSALHRIASDEVWHFYAGHALHVMMIHPGGGLERLRLGPDLEEGDVFQGVAPAGCWFGASLAEPFEAPDFALVGCTVAPGFDFADFELGRREELLAAYPQHADLIGRLTRG